MAHPSIPLLPVIGSGLTVSLILSLPAIYNVWLKKQFYRSVSEDLHYPITLGAYWLKEWAYKFTAFPFLMIAVVTPLLIRPAWMGWPYEIGFLILVCCGPALLAIGCWQTGNFCRSRKLVLEETFITYVESPQHQIRIEKNNIERYWIGIEGNLVLKLKSQQRRLLIPLAFENIALINKSLISIYYKRP